MQERYDSIQVWAKILTAVAVLAMNAMAQTWAYPVARNAFGSLAMGSSMFVFAALLFSLEQGRPLAQRSSYSVALAFLLCLVGALLSGKALWNLNACSGVGPYPICTMTDADMQKVKDEQDAGKSPPGKT